MVDNWSRTSSRAYSKAYTTKLSKDAVLAEYAKTGFEPRFAEAFWQQYSATYDRISEEMPEEEDNSDYALRTAKRGIPWYILYKNIGHPEKWCQMAWNFGAYEDGKTDSLRDISDCLWEIVRDRFIEHDPDLEKELKRHCDFIGKSFGKSPIYMRFYFEWFFHELNGGSELLDYFDRMESAYNDAISQGKSEDFAYFYATWGRSGAWRIAELREKLQDQGWDDCYIRTYLAVYADGLEEDGEEREHPDIPAYWEEKVEAFMKGWDYARKHGLDHKFAERFRDIYLNLSHPDEMPDYPFSEIEEKAVQETLKRYGKSI